MVLQIWCVRFVSVSGFRNCVTSKDLVCKQLEKNGKFWPLQLSSIGNEMKAFSRHIPVK